MLEIGSIHSDNQINNLIKDAPMKLGQIVQGKVLKLFPNQRATLQIGADTIQAKLETPLQVGGRYHLQVQSLEPEVKLQVVGDELPQQTDQQALSLLRQLGLSSKPAHRDLLELIMSKKIPFTKSQLNQAFSLMDGAKNKQMAQKTLASLLANKLPLSPAVFQAVYTKETKNISQQLNALSTLLNEQSNHDLPVTIKQDLQAILKPSPLLEQRPNEAFTKHVENVLRLLDAKGSAKTSAHQRPDFETSDEMANKKPGQVNGKSVLQRVINTLADTLPLTAKRSYMAFPSLEQKPSSFNDKVAGQSTFNHSDSELDQITKDSIKLTSAQAVLEELTGKTTEQKVASLLKLSPLLLKQTDELLLQRMFNQVSLNRANGGEHSQQIEQQSDSIKATLAGLLTNNTGHSQNQEHIQQMIHFINGLQIQGVQDSANMIQASIQLPGKALGLKQDADLEFQGKKTDTGEISKDNCRILFYLNLQVLKETILSMNVQKRSVSLVIYNDTDYLDRPVASWKAQLKDALEQLDYHLSSVSVKPIKKVEQEVKHDLVKTKQGVDFRV